MKKYLKRCKEFFRIISILGVIPNAVAGFFGNIQLQLISLIIQLSCFGLMFIVGWKRE